MFQPKHIVLWIMEVKRVSTEIISSTIRKLSHYLHGNMQTHTTHALRLLYYILKHILNHNNWSRVLQSLCFIIFVGLLLLIKVLSYCSFSVLSIVMCDLKHFINNPISFKTFIFLILLIASCCLAESISFANSHLTDKTGRWFHSSSPMLQFLIRTSLLKFLASSGSAFPP